VIAADNLPVQVACKVLGVSESGYYAHRHRAPSERSIRHAVLSDLIGQIHIESHGIYGGGASTPSSPSGEESWSVTTKSNC